MILSIDQLKSCIHGAVEYSEINGYLECYRFTEKQRAYYANSRFASKENASSGCFFEVETDADEFFAEYEVRRTSSVKRYSYDFYLNDVLVDHVSEPYENEGVGSFHFFIPKGTNKIRLMFCNLSSTGLKNVELVNATYFHPVMRSLKYIAYGDSITQGYIADFPSLTYASTVAKHFNADLYNLGVGGEEFCPDMPDADYPVSPDFVTVAYGTNDWSHAEKSAFEENRDCFFEKLASMYSCPIFVLLPLFRRDAATRITSVGKFEEARDSIRATAEKYNQMVVIDGMNLVPHTLQFFAPDALHPNDLGFSQYSAALIDRMAPIVNHLK